MTLCMIPQIAFTVKGLSADFTAVRRRNLGVLFHSWNFLYLRSLQALRVLIVVNLPGVTPAMSL